MLVKWRFNASVGRCTKTKVRAVLPVIAIAGIFGCATMEVAWADPWPTKPIKMVVPFPPGAAPDVIARLLADRLTSILGQSIYIENKPGAGAIPGMATLARSTPDGYTIGFVPAAAVTLTPILYKAPQYNIDTDLAPIALVATGPMMIAVNAASGISSMDELVRYAKTNVGKVNFAAAQTNSVPHLTGEVLSRTGNLGFFTIPYSGSQTAITAVLSGDALLTIDGLPALMQHVKAGKLKAIAVTSDKRLPGFEDIPSVAETFPGFDSLGWFVVYVPNGVPASVVEQLNQGINKAIQNQELINRFADLGVYPKAGTTASASEFIQVQRATWQKTIGQLGLKAQ